MGQQPSTEPEGAEGGEPDSRTNRTTRTHLLLISRAHNKFSIQLYQEYAKDGKRPGNFVFSPLGLNIGLGLLYLGSRGPSKDEIHKTLHLAEVQDIQMLPAFAAMHWDVIRSTLPKGCIFEVAIRLFSVLDRHMTSNYQEICTTYELSRLKSVDFRNRHDLARKEINSWTDERTRGKIKDVIPMGIVDRDTSVLMLVAIFMRVQWHRQFDPKKSSTMPFYLAMKETPQVKNMNQTNLFKYTHSNKLDCDVLEMPFANNHVKLVAMLPRKPEGLNKMEGKLSRSMLEAVCETMTEETVEVTFPKFRYELGILMGDMLQKMGIKTVFAHGKADLTALDGSRDSYLSRIFHHLYLEFDEGLGDGPLPSNDPPKLDMDNKKVFKADHPFFFFIKDDRTGAIMIIGRVVRPLLASP